MTLLLTFLGTGNYQACTYRVADPPDSASVGAPETYFSVALARHLRPDRIISLETAAAAEKHGQALGDALAPYCREHLPVRIPEGKSEAELWEIFQCLTENIPAGCTLHLDITHGFRSLPLLGFIALAYLRVARKVNIGGICYGAREAMDDKGIAPVFDLSPFLELLDWTSAADSFFSTGSASRLARLLESAHQKQWKMSGNVSRETLPRSLKPLAQQLTEASRNLLLLRTGALAEATASLRLQIERARGEAAAHASPFLEVVEPVGQQLCQFGDTDLGTLRDLVGWLAGRDQTAAALTLASEWLTSYLMVSLGQKNHHTRYRERQPYSTALSKLGDPSMEIIMDETGKAALTILGQLQAKFTEDVLKQLGGLASTIRSARNDINHAGFNDQPAKAAALGERGRVVARDLESLPLP
jgi:CRISPR-associated DxTHG motif protein